MFSKCIHGLYELGNLADGFLRIFKGKQGKRDSAFPQISLICCLLKLCIFPHFAIMISGNSFLKTAV